MSFILDALRKSENERQSQGAKEFSGVPVSNDPPSMPRWLWIVGLLLAINLAVLVGLIMRPDITPPRPAVQPATQEITRLPTPVPEDTPSFAERVAAAREQASPAQSESASATEETATRPLIVAQDPASLDTSRTYPIFQEVLASGAVSLPTLVIDIHVYSEVPSDRFVFINMSKYREGARLEEGPLLREIRADGAVLEHQGVSFLLPRE